MRHKIIVLFLALLLWHSNLQAQANKEFYIQGYAEKDTYKYFDSIHHLRKESLQNLNNSYQFYVVFKIDTNGIVKDFEFIEIPGPPLPDLAKAYVEEIFASTNGKWENKNMGLKKESSGDLLFCLYLLKTNQEPEERFKDMRNVTEFALTGLPMHRRMKGNDIMNEKILTLSF